MIPMTSLLILWTLICQSQSNVPQIFNQERWIPFSDEIAKYQANDSQGRGNDLIPISESWKADYATIFVGIASFRDKRCAVTLKNIYEKAKHPDRIFVGIIQQRHTEDDKIDCIRDYCKMMKDPSHCPYRSNIKLIEFSSLDARGPSYARSMQRQLMQNEEYCLQIDSHTDAIQDWDVEVLKMWGSISNEYAILSTRPPDVSSLKSNDNEGRVPHLCQATYTSEGMLRSLQPRLARDLDKPILAPLWAAGFSFSKCHAEKKVPYDPHLPFIFDGEEFSRFARYWTRGYDVYTPSKIIFGHDYTEKLASGLPEFIRDPIHTDGNKEPYKVDPMEWSRHGMTPEYRRQIYDDAVNRIKLLLSGAVDGQKMDDKELLVNQLATLTKYGLGRKRTLDELIEFTGIDLRSSTVFGDRCIPLRWVPFEVDSDPQVDDNDVWGFGPEMRQQGGRDIPIIRSEVIVVKVPAATPDKILETSSAHEVSTESESSMDVDQESTWFALSVLDSLITSTVAYIDSKVGPGRGIQILKVILLASPVFGGILILAIWLLTANNKKASILASKLV